MVSGQVTLMVADATAFVEDSRSKISVQKAIASQAGVADSEVLVSLSVVISYGLRRLQGSEVQIDFAIVPSSASEGNALVSTLQSLDAGDLGKAIESEMTDATGEVYAIEVASFHATTETGSASSLDKTFTRTSTTSEETGSTISLDQTFTRTSTASSLTHPQIGEAQTRSTTDISSPVESKAGSAGICCTLATLALVQQS